MVDRATAFRPLTDEERAASVTVEAKPAPEPVCPVPDGVPEMTFKHPAYGPPVKAWRYTLADARTAFYTARFEKPDGGKDILPIAYCRLPGGGMGWRSKWPKAPRPLYRITEIRGRKNAPVLVVEGEKTADAAERLFIDYVATCASGGTNAVKHSDWTPVEGRAVAIWPDNDTPGRECADKVARLCMESGAASVRIVPVPDDWPQGWDVADALPDGVTPEALRDMLDNADPWEPDAAPRYVSFSNYRAGPQGVRFDGGEDEEQLTLCGPLEVLAQTRSAEGGDWGLLVRWQDDDGGAHEWAMPRALLAGDGAQVWAEFLRGGLYIAPGRKNRNLLASYLGTVKVDERARAVSRYGWHGGAFLLPDEVIGARGAERIILQTDFYTEHAFRTRGTLDEWRANVAACAVGNSRLAFGISAGFAAPLLHHTGGESGGAQFTGPSSVGKTTLLCSAASVWGGNPDDPLGYCRQWRATANGLEGVAAVHSDALLCLDEIGQASGREVADTVYMLANGQGKSRASRTGHARQVQRWRTFVLSTGEIGIDAKIREDGRKIGARAGQMVRLIDIPADAGAGHGIFETLHGHADGRELSDALRAACKQYYGTAARAFIRKLAAGGLDRIAAAFATFRDDFERNTCPARADGQVKRTAARFALVGFAGEMASRMGITGWPQGEARLASETCFLAWLENRGGAGDAETMNGLEQVRAFLDLHGASRFPFVDDDGLSSAGPVRDRAGYRRRTEEGVEYCVFPTVWQREVTQGFNGGALLDVLRAQGHLRADTGRLTFQIRAPDGARVRVHILKPSFYSEGDADD